MQAEKSIEQFLSGTSFERSKLKMLSAQYPYFGMLHFYLLKNTDPSNNEYKNIARTTALHVNNPYHLQCLLSDNDILDNLDFPIIEQKKEILSKQFIFRRLFHNMPYFFQRLRKKRIKHQL